MRTTHINDGWLDTTSTDEREILDFRGEGFAPLLSLGRFHYHHATEPLPDQQHDDWLVLVFALDGIQNFQVGGGRLHLSAGQVLRLVPGTCYGSGPWPEQRGTVAWMILATAPGRQELGIDATMWDGLLGRLADPRGPVILPQPPMTAELLECAFSAWSQRGIPLRCELLRHRLAALLMEVVAALDEHQDGVHERPDFAAARIREVMDWLRVDPRRGKRVADLVARARLSEARFFREFKAVAGVTPKEFVLRLKVEEAAMMLMRDPACPVTTIAHDLGFSSSQHFATVFREYLLVSPSDYRARCKRVQ